MDTRTLQKGLPTLQLLSAIIVLLSSLLLPSHSCSDHRRKL